MNEDLLHRAPRSPRRLQAFLLAGFAAAVVLGAASCTVSEKTPFIIGNDLADGSTSSGFVPAPEPDGGGRNELTEYCPSSRCPDGYTTCPDSTFRCDVNLKNDRSNCGECGHACPTGLSDTYECIEGKCVVVCGTDRTDCDGIIDNGCEVMPSDPLNCGGICGNACDPATPCIGNLIQGYHCGCPPGLTRCGATATLLSCVDTDSRDDHCGDCGVVCDRNGDAGAPPPNARYGCVGGKCGQLKCNADYADCNADPGCETLLTTTENCGKCGNVCAPGQVCARDGQDEAYTCMCPPGFTRCPYSGAAAGREYCVDIKTDPLHCGSCRNRCEDQSNGYMPGVSGKTVVAMCVHGTCDYTCVAGRADCNGNRNDGCETNTNSDPNNCGGCGIVCDAVAGQACAGGRCVVEACDQIDAGPVAK